ncbi:hypothetical protein Shyhy01_53900 [Streptomyces hygroscopicus subsp. hygroscopicus]|nr:hypothetical protein Shyhy01_53900 [Streptomyces hygroscopicus subsp. hygroscopicus]
MLPPKRPHITETSTIPYQSAVCCIGIHLACVESSPVSAPIDLPLVYETCACPCHTVSPRSMKAEAER